MAEGPLSKKIKIEPQPPERPPEGQPEGEAIAVVASRVGPDGLESVTSAFRKKLQRIDFKLDQEKDLKNFLEKFRATFEHHIKDYLAEHHGLKVYLVLTISYVSQEFPEREPWIFYLGTEAMSIKLENQISETVRVIFQQVETKNDHLVRTKTGLILDELNWASIFFSQFSPLSGEIFQDLPKFLKNKHAIINVQNTDNRCFGYSILAFLNPITKNAHFPIFYNKLFKEYGLDNIQYPVEIDDIPAIEEKLQIAINVFSFFDDEGKARYPKFISKKKEQFKREVDLLFWNNHYAYIKNFSAFISDLHWSNRKKKFCKQCFGFFLDNVSYELHLPYCKEMGIPDPIFIFPIENTFLHFENIRCMEIVPFVIYADFECLLLDTKIKSGEMSQYYSTHIPCSIAFKIVSRDQSLPSFPLELHSGPDSSTWFLKRVSEIETQCMEILYDEKRMNFTDEDKHNFAIQTLCYICYKKFESEKEKVRDHDHRTGIYRGAAHSKCNLKFRKCNKIPVFFHNFRGYDSHLIVKGLTQFPKKKIRIIGQGMEKYLTLSFGEHAIFKDSYQFLAASLEQLAKNLNNSGI